MVGGTDKKSRCSESRHISVCSGKSPLRPWRTQGSAKLSQPDEDHTTRSSINSGNDKVVDWSHFSPSFRRLIYWILESFRKESAEALCPPLSWWPHPPPGLLSVGCVYRGPQSRRVGCANVLRMHSSPSPSLRRGVFRDTHIVGRGGWPEGPEEASECESLSLTLTAHQAGRSSSPNETASQHSIWRPVWVDNAVAF